jgi:hypothetical protein
VSKMSKMVLNLAYLYQKIKIIKILLIYIYYNVVWGWYNRLFARGLRMGDIYHDK